MHLRKYISLLVIAAISFFAFFNAGCRASYGFNNVSIPDSMKTINVHFIENMAPYRNPQLSPALTERLKRKILNQTRLRQTNSDNADYDVKATISDYSISTSGVTEKKGALNRLNVTVHIALLDNRSQKTEEYDVNWKTDFDANLSLQAAESQIFDTMIKSLADDIFNRMFSNW